MVELKHCPSKDTPVDPESDFFTRLKDHAVEFYEATPEQHRECLRNTFNKVRSREVGDGCERPHAHRAPKW